jgi:hypothetical protein
MFSPTLKPNLNSEVNKATETSSQTLFAAVEVIP